MMRPTRIVHVLSLAILVATAARAQTPRVGVAVSSGSNVDPSNGRAVAANSTGTAAISTRAVNVTNQNLVPAGLVSKSITVTSAIPRVVSILTGLGETLNKFSTNGQGQLTGNSDLVTSTSRSMGTTALARASWAGVPQANNVVQSNLRAQVNVYNTTPGTPPQGFAAAGAHDPIAFSYSTPGTLTLNVSAGTTTIDTDPLTGLPINSLSILSLDPGATAHLDITAALTGVTLNGQALNGDLFDLSIDAGGVVTSAANLNIQFAPWSGLGLSQADITNLINYVESNLNTLPDGSVGLGPGATLAIFGAGSPLPALTFQASGDVMYSDNVTGVASVPEPSSLALCSLGLAVVGGIAARRRTSAAV